MYRVISVAFLVAALYLFGNQAVAQFEQQIAARHAQLNK